MEDLISQLGVFLTKKNQIEEKWNAEVESINERLSLILFQSPSNTSVGSPNNLNITPKQIKKRPKRVSSLDSLDENVNLNPSPKYSEPETGSTSAPNEVPCPITQVIEPLESSVSENQRVPRPTRAAKLKIENSLKEPSLRGKFRRPSNPDDTASKNLTLNSTQKEKTINAESENRKSSNTENEILEAHIDLPSSNNAKSNDEEMPLANESIEIISVKDLIIEIISDNETDKMPPPLAPPKKKALRSKNKASYVQVERRSIKKEKNSMLGSEDVNLSKNDVQMLEQPAVSIKKEKELENSVPPSSASSISSTVSTESKRGRKPKKALKHKPIKEERLSEIGPSEVIETTSQPMRTRSSKEKKSIESVYEDAICNNEPIVNNNDKNEQPNSGTSNDIQMKKSNGKPATDVTFVSNNDEKNSPNSDTTFVTNPVQTTFIMEKISNETIITSKNNDDQQNANATFEVNTAKSNDKENNSLITEDESFDAPEVPKYKTIKSNQKKKELFNPCVQSPLKKKVEAFEKVAAGSTSPPQRQTRTKTRAKKKENVEPEHMVIRELKYSASTSNVTTPTVQTRTGHLGRFLTPTQQIPANAQLISSGAVKKMPNSASKIQTFPTKAGTSVFKSSSSSSIGTLSREQSAEDLKGGIRQLQKLADERKKKREQKQQQAAQSREAKEKERTDRLRKLMEEREEKRRKALEAERRKRELEDIDKNLKMQEEKREAAKRLEKEKLRQRAAAEEMARKERELEKMRLIKHQNDIKMQLQQQQKESYLKKKKQQMPTYDFDMLNSDDSTDEEGKFSEKRPPIPEWSTTARRGSFIACQNFLPSKVIDSLFSVQPMTPDLKQIFPAIDARHLKRNSSVIWRTPTRYSAMPKH